MNFRRALFESDDLFQVAPLLSVLFLLVTFFIVTGALSAEERETAIYLPQTASAPLQNRERIDVVVTVTRDGSISILNQSYSVDGLRRKLSDLQQSAPSVPVTVIIRADGKARHEDVLRVLDACAGAGIRGVSFVSEHSDKPTE